MFIKLLYIKKFKYNPMENLIRAFNDLILLLELNNHIIYVENVKVSLSMKFKNIIYIDNKDGSGYEIKINIDTISWNANIYVVDKFSQRRYAFDVDLNNGFNVPYPEISSIKDIISMVFNMVFDDFIYDL